MKLTREQQFALAGAASCDPRTVARLYETGRCQAIVRERVVAAAKKLKMPAPPVEKA